jgi:hypothetical protein
MRPSERLLNANDVKEGEEGEERRRGNPWDV